MTITRRRLIGIGSLAAAAIGVGQRRVWAANMKIYAQWAKANPGDWTLLDTGNWPSRPTKADPIGDAGLDALGAPISLGDVQLDNQAGWVFALNCQGVTFGTNDHIAVQPHDPSGGAVVTAWNDDPFWYPVGWKVANTWTFEPLQYDPRVGAINTKQSQLLYAEPLLYQSLIDRVGPLPYLRPWDEFVAPPASVTKHGVWLSDAKWDEHVASRGLHGWREWGV